MNRPTSAAHAALSAHAALDRAAVRAMVSVVGSYTLEALVDHEQRAQHKQQCAERLLRNVAIGQQVQYTEQALLANLDWGIDALEEAMRANSHDIKVARLDHAEKMLQVCALLDSRATTVGVPNCYLSAWAHLNLAFVWKLRGNDRKAADHMLEMFFVDPLYSRVDFAPALWEHLFLPHLPNVVDWYTKQRQSIMVNTPRETSEYQMSFSNSMSSSTDINFTVANDLQINVLNLSADQTSQLQALEKLYQDSLDENTQQYAKYYKDWLNSDLANKRGMPQDPIADPPVTPMPEVCTHLSEVQASTEVAQVVVVPQLLGQKRISASSLSTRPSALDPLQQFKEFDNPEFSEYGRLPGITRNGLQDDMDSPDSDFRRQPVGELCYPGNIAMSTLQSEPVQPVIITASPTPEPLSSPGASYQKIVSVGMTTIRSGTATPQYMLEELSTEDADAGEKLNDMKNPDLKVPPSGLREKLGPDPFGAAAPAPDGLDCKLNPDLTNPKIVDRKHSDQPDNSLSPRANCEYDSTGRIVGCGDSNASACYFSTSSESTHANCKFGTQAMSGRYHDLRLSIRTGANHLCEVPGNKSGYTSPARSRAGGSEYCLQGSAVVPDGNSSDDTSNFEVQIAQVQEPILEPRPEEFSGSIKLIQAGVTATSSSPPSLRFVSRYHCDDDGTESEASLEPGCGWNQDDDDREDDDDDDDDERFGIPTPPASVERYISKKTHFPPILGPESPTESSASVIVRDHEDCQECNGRIHMHNISESGEPNASLIGNSTIAASLMRPPKDFVCPITSQLFNDPVTLETGQTYERKAIQEWLHRGNMSCPITRHVLSVRSLPKTNYVLKRLVDCWKEQHPKVATEFGCSLVLLNGDPPLSPTGLKKSRIMSDFMERSLPEPYSPCSVFSVSSLESTGRGGPTQHFTKRTLGNDNTNDRSSPTNPEDVDELIMDLKVALTCLCLSNDLAECESVILEIAGLFQETRGHQKMVAVLNKAGVIHGMIEVLSNSTQVMVLSATLFLLSGLISTDDMTRKTVVSADPELECLTGLLRKGLTLTVVVLYQLRLPNQQLASLNLLPLLVVVIHQTEENRVWGVGRGEHDLHSLMMSPKSAAIMLLEQIVTGGDQANFLRSGQTLLSLRPAPALITSLNQARSIDERTSVVSLLLCCMQLDWCIRNMVAQTCDLAPVVKLLHSGNNRAQTVAISFFNDLVRLNRRALCNRILQTVKAEGLLSSMHVMLIHLQLAPLEHRPAAARLLLQLDLLEEPRGRSMYRGEAVESLVEALTSMEWQCPVEAATTLISLSGRFSYSGKPMMEAWLLKTAGLEECFQTFMKDEQGASEQWKVDQDEEKAAKVWERRVAGALVGHELIEALGQGLQSKNPEVSKPCRIVATWLMNLLPILPDTGIRQSARKFLLEHFVGVLQNSMDLQQRVLAALAIHSFISDPEGIQELLSYVQDISGPLRELQKSTWVASTILRAFTAHADANSPNLWVHAEQGQLDTSANGEVRALVLASSRIFSGHSDGTIKIWDAKKKIPVLLQEHKEHTKSIKALTVSLNSDRLYSGSLDKSIRVWALGSEHIHILHVFDLKDAVMGLVVSGPMACIIPYGSGIKVQLEENATRSLNLNKHVHSLAITKGKIFCGCTDNSVQEIDPKSGSVNSVQHGVRTLLGKKSIYAIQVFSDHLYVAGSPVDGVAGKVWRLSNYALIGSLCTTAEVRSMAVSEDFIYLGSRSGVIEVWLRKRLLKVSTMNAGSKVISLMVDGDTLYSGSKDGKIRVWKIT